MSEAEGSARSGTGTGSNDDKKKARASIMVGLTLGLLIASLDQTVVGTSLPKIVSELGGLDRFSWLFSAYMLAATIMIPLAGKMSDRYGRRPMFLFGMAFFLAGSALSGLSQNMDQLILFRFVQGFGGGAMFPVAVATVADLYPPADRGKMQGALGAVFALASIVGPFAGGWIVDNVNWRWVFYVNLPVGAAAIAVTSVKFPRTEADLGNKIDYLGIAFITAALSSGLLITFWGGSTYSWTSPEILLLAMACMAFSVAFLYVETIAGDPMLPLPMFKNSVFTLCCVCLMIMSMGLLGVVAFLPLFLQAVIGISATYSGEVLVPLMITAMVGAMSSGLLLKRTGYKPWIVSGPIIAVIGMYLLSTLHSGSSISETVIYLMVMGLGLGFTMSNFIVAGQNVVFRKEMGVASSTMTLFRSLGGTIGVTVLGVVVNRRMEMELAANLPPGSADVLPSDDINTLGELLMSPLAANYPADIIEGIRDSLGGSITYMFYVAACVIFCAFVLTWFVKRVPLKERDEYDQDASVTTASDVDVGSDVAPK